MSMEETMENSRDHSDLLFDYATGALGEGPSLIVATQLAIHGRGRDEVADTEAIGGAFLDDIEPAEISGSLLERTLDRLNEEGSVPAVPLAALDEDTRAVVPHPLQRYLPADLDDLSWSRQGKRVESSPLHLSSGPYKASLLRIKAGEAIPRHTHKGVEYTLVLAGGFTDDSGHHVRGDLTVCDGSVEHSPVADTDEDCLCLTVLDAPIKMTGPIARFANPFIRF